MCDAVWSRFIVGLDANENVRLVQQQQVCNWQQFTAEIGQKIGLDRSADVLVNQRTNGLWARRNGNKVEIGRKWTSLASVPILDCFFYSHCLIGLVHNYRLYLIIAFRYLYITINYVSSHVYTRVLYGRNKTMEDIRCMVIAVTHRLFWDDDHRQCGGILCLHNISLSLDSDYKSFASKTHI